MDLSWPDVLTRLTRRESLTEAEAQGTLQSVLAGEATPAQIGAFLTLLHAKGESIEEVTGLARAMVDAAVPLPLAPPAAGASAMVVDLVGTGGDRLSSINVTTLASLIVAGCGVRVCKHGGRSASSSVGSADASVRRASASASPSAFTRPCAMWRRCAGSSVCRPSSTSSGR